MKTEGELYHPRQADARIDHPFRGFKKKLRTEVVEPLSLSQMTAASSDREARPTKRQIHLRLSIFAALREDLLHAPASPSRRSDGHRESQERVFPSERKPQTNRRLTRDRRHQNRGASGSRCGFAVLRVASLVSQWEVPEEARPCFLSAQFGSACLWPSSKNVGGDQSGFSPFCFHAGASRKCSLPGEGSHPPFWPCRNQIRWRRPGTGVEAGKNRLCSRAQ